MGWLDSRITSGSTGRARSNRLRTERVVVSKVSMERSRMVMVLVFLMFLLFYSSPFPSAHNCNVFAHDYKIASSSLLKCHLFSSLENYTSAFLR